MTTPEAFPIGIPSGSAGERAHADLVGRLAREISGQGLGQGGWGRPRAGRRPRRCPRGRKPRRAKGCRKAFEGCRRASSASPRHRPAAQPPGLQPDASALAARSFGAPPLGLPGLSGPTLPNLAPASPAFFDVAAIPPVHPASPRPGLPDFSFAAPARERRPARASRRAGAAPPDRGRPPARERLRPRARPAARAGRSVEGWR